MILDDHFDRIVILSLPRSADRAARALAELRYKGLSDQAVVVRAIDGKLSPPSDWWAAGPGAWGCMQSHYRVVQDALHDGIESLLVIEDDAIWQQSAATLAAEFLAQVPDDWGQIYFGGQHRGSHLPQALAGKPAVMKARSVHRTHAYAIHQRAMVPFLKHVLYAPDYINAKEKEKYSAHIDHQLERAHRRGDWPVYCPSWWLAGQGENRSEINGRQHPDQWWHLVWREAHRRLPLVICDHRPPTVGEMRWLHFGKHLDEKQPWIDTGVSQVATREDLRRVMEIIAQEALGGQRLPAICDFTGEDEKIAFLLEKWLGPVIRLSETPDLEKLCDFPGHKTIVHDWFNPPLPRRVEVVEPSESTDATAAAGARLRVHQVWLGGAELPPRLDAYRGTIARAFQGWDYKLWGEADMAALAANAMLPGPLVDPAFPVGLRSDIVRLEILRQQGGVYFDTDFEALRPDLSTLFERAGCFCYGDEKSGRPSNAMMAASAGHPFVEFYLRRIAQVLRVPDDLWDTVRISGPDKLAECLNLWVGDWTLNEPLLAGDQRLGSLYAGGSIAGFWKETFYPYHFKEGTWATFEPEQFPQAWAVHHWEGGWSRDRKATV